MVFLQDSDNTSIGVYVQNIKEHYNFKEVECEIRAGLTLPKFEGITNQITLPKFRKLNEYFDNLNSDSDDITSVKSLDVRPSLDITFLKPRQTSQANINLNVSNLRFTLNGRNAITSYCSTNEIPTYKSSENNVELIFKDLLRSGDTDESANIDLDSIRTRIGGKVELAYDFLNRQFKPSDMSSKYLTDLTRKADTIYGTISRNVHNQSKIFRFKKRKSYEITFKDVLFRIDLTVVKSSKTGSNGWPIGVGHFVDAQVAEQDETYEYEIEFDLKDKGETILTDFINTIYIPSFINTHIHPSYTILSTQTKVLEAYKDVIKTLISKRLANKITCVENAIKYTSPETNATDKTKIEDAYPGKYNFFNIIKNKKLTELQKMRQDYMHKSSDDGAKRRMFNGDTLYFISPKVVSIELNNIRDDSINSIISNYTVTDKADGYSMILIKFSKADTTDPELIDHMFLIDSNLRVYDTGLTSSKKDSGTMLLNGEYLEHDKTKKKRLNKYGIFDCYIYDNEDVCEYPLMSADTQIKTRLRFAEEFLSKEYTKPEEIKDIFSIFLKKFYIADEKMTIFQCAKTIWSGYEGGEINPDIGESYYLDGLIFTRADYPVGYNANKPDFNLRQNITWLSNIKWKPPEDNTIDFLIRFEKDEVVKQGNRVITTNKIKRIPRRSGAETSYDQHIVANLYNGNGGMRHKNNTTNDNPNICFKHVNTQRDSLVPVLFQPSQPNIPNIGQILLPIVKDSISGKMVAKDDEGNIIDDDTIVEVSYTNFDELSHEYESHPNLRWGIMRTRHDKTFNYKQGVHAQKKSLGIINSALRFVKTTVDLNPFQTKLVERAYKMCRNIPNYRKNPGVTEIQSVKDNKDLIETYFNSHEMVKTNINFGNHSDVANNIWRSIYNPVTQDMITTGNNIPDLSEEEKKYYNRDVKRDKSISLSMQDFHNKVIKNRVLLGSVSKIIKKKQDTISLLDLACGKGGDLSKWRDNNITTCVGIDYMRNNIDDDKDGACNRYKFYKSQAENQGRPFPKSYFLVGDVGKSMSNDNYIQNRDYKQLHRLLWDTDKLSTNFKKNKFDVVSVMFALHYFFSRESVLDTFIKNVADNVKSGGYFIGCCFDGKKIFDQLKKVPKGGSLDAMKNGRIMWKIIRNYSRNEFNADDSSLGMSIKVYISSINQIIEEYLVNFDYLKEKMEKYGLIPLTGTELKELNIGSINSESIDSFENIFNLKTNSDIHNITSKLNMSQEEKDLSFMFKYFIFKKKTSGEETLHQIVDILRSSQYQDKMKQESSRAKLLTDSSLRFYDKAILRQAITIAHKKNMESLSQESQKHDTVELSETLEDESKTGSSGEGDIEYSDDESKKSESAGSKTVEDLRGKGTAVVLHKPGTGKKKPKKKDVNTDELVNKTVKTFDTLIKLQLSKKTIQVLKKRRLKGIAIGKIDDIISKHSLQSNEKMMGIRKRVLES